MSTKNVSPPLETPLSEKRAVGVVGRNINSQATSLDKGRGKGVAKGGRARVRKLFVALRCMSCGEVQNLVYGGYGIGNELFHPSMEELFSEKWCSIRPPQWHRCINCHELQPTIGYLAVDWGSEPCYSPAHLRAMCHPGAVRK